MYQAIRFEVSLVLYIMTIRFVTLMVSTEVMRGLVIARQGMTSRVLFYSNVDSVVVGRSDQTQLVLTRMPFDLESRSITINCIADGILGGALEGCHRSWLACRRRGAKNSLEVMAKVIALWPATETAIAWIHPRHMRILPTAWRANPRIRGNIPHSVETSHAYVETPHAYVERPHACVKTFYILVETIHSLWKHSTFLWSHQKVPTLVWKLSTYVWKQSTPCGNIPRFRRLIAKYPHQCGNFPHMCGNNTHLVETFHNSVG